MNARCNCLVAEGYGGAHYDACAVAADQVAVDRRPERALAEAAAYRDIDLALGCLGQIDHAAPKRRGGHNPRAGMYGADKWGRAPGGGR